MSSYHPLLPAGFNSIEMNADEVDGAGVNATIWPVYIDGSFVPAPLVSFPSFWDDVDLRVRFARSTFDVHAERLTLQVR